MKKIYSLVIFCLISAFSWGQISITSLGSAFTQDFNTLAASGTSALTPTGWFFLETGTNANSTYSANNGSGTGGETYSYGANASLERALGGLLSGSLNPTIGAHFVNNSGSTINSLEVSFIGEQWRIGTLGRPDRLDFQYSVNATSLNTGTYIDANALDFTAPTTTGTLGALDGNAVANRTAVSFVITGLNIPVGNTFWIRWVEFNASGADDGLAIDDFSITATGGGADVTLPTISILTPLDNASNVSTNTNLEITFSEPVLKGTGNILIKQVSDDLTVQTIDVTNAAVSVTGSTVTVAINALTNSTEYYVEIASGAFTDAALNPFAGISGALTWNFTTAPIPAVGIIGNNYTFTNCATTFINEGWLQYSVTGPSQFWSCTTPGRTDANAVQMNAYVAANNSPLNEDWLISPAFDLTTASLPTLKFYSKGDFLGNSLQLKISSNYVSGTDPNTATWTNLNGNFPANVTGTGVWTLSDNIDLSLYNTANVRLAWVYINPTTTASSRWSIDDISVNLNIPCPEPSAQPTSLNLNATVSTVTGTFTPVSTPTTIENYLIVRSFDNTLTQFPVDGTVYTNGQVIGGGNGTVITISNDGSFTDNTIASSTQYYYFVFSTEDQDCVGGPNYNLVNPLTMGVLTAAPSPCVTPAAPTNPFTLTPANTSITGSFTGSGASKYLVIRSTVVPPLGASPTDGIVYTTGQAIGNGTVVNYTSLSTFTAGGLTVATPYYFYVFAANDACIGEPFYSASSLNGTATTTNNPTGIPAGYYDAATGLTCAPLKTTLSSIITNGHTQNNYAGLDDTEFLTTDDRLNDAETQTVVYDMYSDNPTGADPYTYTFSQFNIGSGSDGEGNGWNKEHSFPNSWFSASSSTSNFPGADLHHIYPTDMDVNSLRGNFPFGEVATATTTTSNGSKLGNSAISFGGYSGSVFEPIDAYKGDFARATLYMVTRYQAEQPTWESLQSTGDVVMDGTTWPSIEIDYLRMLIQWHNADPVSIKEIERNNEVFGYQNNRNPFIDHPEYVGLIWSTSCGIALPITLTSFDAQLVSKKVNLKWTAENPQGFSHFDIERSTDAVNFTPIGQVTSVNPGSFFFTDNNLPQTSKVYYRLKLVDLDGNYRYSKIANVRLNTDQLKAIIYPNPVSEKLQFNFSEPLFSNSTLQIINSNGVIVLTQLISTGNNQHRTNVSNLPAGKYFITISNKRQLIKTSFVISR